MADAGIPYINQTAYRKKSSCADAIFATQEVIARYVGSAIRMIYRKIQQEYPVLLERYRDKYYNFGGSSYSRVE